MRAPQAAGRRPLKAPPGWQRSMQIVNDGAYLDTLHRFIRRAVTSGRGLDERDGDGRTALHWAAANGFQVRRCSVPRNRCGAAAP